MATVVVNGGGITQHEITNPGSGWQVGNFGYFNKAQIGPSGSDGVLQVSSTTNNGFTRSQLGISKDLTVQITGAGTTQGGHYRLISVPTSNTVALARTTGDPIITTDQYAFIVGPTIQSDATTVTTGAGTPDEVSTTTFTSSADNAHGLSLIHI